MTDLNDLSYYFNLKHIQCKPRFGFHLVTFRKPCVKLITSNELACFFVCFPCFKNEASSLLNKAFEKKSNSIMQRVHCFPYFVILSLTWKKKKNLLCYTYVLGLFSVHHIYPSIHPSSTHLLGRYLSIHPSILSINYLSIYLLYIS